MQNQFQPVASFPPASFPSKQGASFSILPMTGFIRQSKLVELVQFSPSTLWRRVKDGKFPAPVKLSERVTAWRVEDVHAWMQAQG